MKNKTISISEEMFEQLKSVENASALIDTLLRNHFLKPEEQIIEEVNEKIEQNKKLIKWGEQFRKNYKDNQGLETDEQITSFLEGDNPEGITAKIEVLLKWKNFLEVEKYANS